MKIEISKITEQALVECRANNIRLTDEDIIVIYELGKIADDTYNEELRYYSGKQLGKVTIYPLTVGAKIWLQYEARELCKFDENLYSLCFVYAYCNSYNSDAFNFKDNLELIKAIKRMRKNVGFTEKELVEVLCEMGEAEPEIDDKEKSKQAEQNPRENKQKSQKTSQTIGMLMREFGGSVNYWLWEIPETAICGLIDGMNDSKTSSGNKVKETKTISSNNKSILAYRKLRAYIECLKLKAKSGVANE